MSESGKLSVKEATAELVILNAATKNASDIKKMLKVDRELYRGQDLLAAKNKLRSIISGADETPSYIRDVEGLIRKINTIADVSSPDVANRLNGFAKGLMEQDEGIRHAYAINEVYSITISDVWETYKEGALLLLQETYELKQSIGGFFEKLVALEKSGSQEAFKLRGYILSRLSGRLDLTMPNQAASIDENRTPKEGRHCLVRLQPRKLAKYPSMDVKFIRIFKTDGLWIYSEREQGKKTTGVITFNHDATLMHLVRVYKGRISILGLRCPERREDPWIGVMAEDQSFEGNNLGLGWGGFATVLMPLDRFKFKQVSKSIGTYQLKPGQIKEFEESNDFLLECYEALTAVNVEASDISKGHYTA